jgi:DNA-binding SARP family transcriptional activator
MLSIAAREIALWDSVDATPGLTDAQRLSSARGRTLCDQLTGLAYAMRGEGELARMYMDRCIATAERSGDRWLLAVMMMRRALAHFMLGDHAAAHRDFGESIPQLRTMGEHWFLSLALEGMAMNALATGGIGAAGAYARESVTTLRPEPDAWFISRSLDAIAIILEAQLTSSNGEDSARQARATVAAQLMGAADGLRRRCGAGIIGPDVARHAATLEALRARVGADAFAAAFAEGERLTLHDIFELMEQDPVISALGAGHPRDTSQPISVESVQERRLLEMAVLGGLSIFDNGAPVPDESMPSGKVLELMLFLLLHRGATKDEVGLALWPDASPAQVRNVFHVTLHHLRRALGSTRWITFDRNVYRFDRSPEPGHLLDLDVDDVLASSAQLRALLREGAVPTPAQLTDTRAALDRNHGRLGQGRVKNDWIVPHQDRVQTAWAEGMDALAQLSLRLGHHDDAASALESLLHREPLRESAHRVYLEVLAARGEPGRALAHYTVLAERLKREVGATPARETRAIIDRLRA